MKRFVLVLTAGLIMAAMFAVTATPAFAAERLAAERLKPAKTLKDASLTLVQPVGTLDTVVVNYDTTLNTI
jgi:hypothetical protein